VLTPGKEFDLRFEEGLFWKRWEAAEHRRHKQSKTNNNHRQQTFFTLTALQFKMKEIRSI
jgi:hypothetical protein